MTPTDTIHFRVLAGAGIGVIGFAAFVAMNGDPGAGACLAQAGGTLIAYHITKDIAVAQHATEQAVVNAQHFAQQAQHYAQLAEQAAQSSGATYVKGLIDQMSTTS